MSQSRKRVIPQYMGDLVNFERLTSSKDKEFIRYRVLENHITSDSYEDSLILDCRLLERKLFHIKNKHASNAIHYKILGCTDPNFGWEELKAETSLAGDSTTYEWDTEPWAYVKIQVKSATSGASGIVDAYIVAQEG